MGFVVRAGGSEKGRGLVFCLWVSFRTVLNFAPNLVHGMPNLTWLRQLLSALDFGLCKLRTENDDSPRRAATRGCPRTTDCAILMVCGGKGCTAPRYGLCLGMAVSGLPVAFLRRFGPSPTFAASDRWPIAWRLRR